MNESRLEQLEAERRQRLWEQAMVRARASHVEDRRAEILAAQVERWQRATDIRAYCEAIEAAQHGDLAAAEWVAWARAHADDIDPTNTPQSLPGPPATVPLDELRPFLDGRSPYGPNRR